MFEILKFGMLSSRWSLFLSWCAALGNGNRNHCKLGEDSVSSHGTSMRRFIQLGSKRNKVKALALHEP
jgi:hypothetical protein